MELEFERMNIIQTVEQQFKKSAVVAVETGDTVRVHQRIREGSRERVQVFEGLVIRVDRRQSLTYRITVRKIASGVGVEKGFMMHSPNVVRVEVTKRARVRRNYISYIRRLTGKSARLKARPFNPGEVNLPPEEPEAKATAEPEADEAKAPAAAEQAPEDQAPDSETDQPEAEEAPDKPAEDGGQAKDEEPAEAEKEPKPEGGPAAEAEKPDNPDSKDKDQAD